MSLISFFIVVKERTNEFGLRMAIGATPRHIITQVLLEALIITLASGLLGMFLGVGVLKLLNILLEATGGMGLLKTTEIDMGIAYLAVFIMVLFRYLCWYLPRSQSFQNRTCSRYAL